MLLTPGAPSAHRLGLLRPCKSFCREMQALCGRGGCGELLSSFNQVVPELDPPLLSMVPELHSPSL